MKINKKYLLYAILVLSTLLISDFVLGYGLFSIYGGDSSTLYKYDLDQDCVQAIVNVTATKDIEFTSSGEREYSLLNCEHNYSIGNRFDSWNCVCTNGEFDLVISTLINTINSYSFSIDFTHN